MLRPVGLLLLETRHDLLDGVGAEDAADLVHVRREPELLRRLQAEQARDPTWSAVSDSSANSYCDMVTPQHISHFRRSNIAHRQQLSLKSGQLKREHLTLLESITAW